MPDDRIATFHIGVERGTRRPDGTFVFAPFDLSPLEVDGVQWTFLAEDARPLTPELLRRIDGLYHYSAPVTEASLEGVDRLVLLARHGVGLDFIDLEACTSRGIGVTITPQGTTRPMASAAVALVLACSHRLRERDRTLHDGDWGPTRFVPQGLGLTGRTLGVIGYGRIGREIVRLLAPWGMDVLVTQRTAVAEDGVEYVSLETLLARSDVVVVACPLTDETRALLDARRLGLMKPTAFLVNVARGAIVDQHALVEALARDASPERGSTSSTPSRCPQAIHCSSSRTSSARRTRSGTPTSSSAAASSPRAPRFCPRAPVEFPPSSPTPPWSTTRSSPRSSPASLPEQEDSHDHDPRAPQAAARLSRPDRRDAGPARRTCDDAARRRRPPLPSPRRH